MQDLNDLYYFVKAVEHGGFAPAGRALGVPKSKLSRRLAVLEERLGLRLVHRSTRHFRLTDAGHTYHQHCKAMLVEAEAAQVALESLRADPRGLIRVTCPIALLHAHVGEMLADFMALYPQVSVQLEATNRRIDVLAEGVDVAIRVRPPPLENSDLVMRVLSERSVCLVASPGLVDRMGVPENPVDLTSWPSLAIGRPQEKQFWLFDPSGENQIRVDHSPRFVTTDMVALRNAALRGVGVVQLPSLMVPQQLAAGSLIRLLPEWRLRQEIIHIVFPSRRGLLPSVRALIDYLAERYASFEED